MYLDQLNLEKAWIFVLEMNQRTEMCLRVAVNLSSVQFLQFDFVQRVKDPLYHFDVQPSQNELETRESILMYVFSLINLTCADLNRLAIRINFDDFGNDYSSFFR